ncbi:L-histidine N(alpha)-methyltransferase [Shewanella surugensis]|uniref:L-histidine N(Alpha)-methyltransferase n=1 Tax=Shewanella surugensis TaxID=212020 RepID=A0ABT0LHS0_9GAMM|nr:L-histidine N(alpha)-methyltransferase [Shewanella surugensis]MCL1127261.1 L-histidine N(alpha)-methyltransferase [Shewanella surugensis]
MFGSTTKKEIRENVFFKHHNVETNDDASELLNGLLKKQKTINPKYFYDTRGSELFEAITQLPEYYPARTEKHILSHNAPEIAQYCGKDAVLIEPGSGSSEKIRLLLNALTPKSYIPMDIAAEFLQRSACQLGEEYPWLNIHAICSDFSKSAQIPTDIPLGKRVIFYPGSTLGNMTPESALVYLKQLRQWVSSTKPGEQGGILIGVDLHKSSTLLSAAYNDAQGITAAFNLNILNNVNQLAHANFDTEKFDHLAFYNEAQQRIEMHLISNIDHIVRVNNHSLTFAKGESIHTENSYKYTIDSFNALVNKAYLTVEKTWLDKESLFSVHYLSPI